MTNNETLKQGDEWLCLDELDWQVLDMGEQQWVDMPRPQAIGFGLVHGPGAVRVRKRGGLFAKGGRVMDPTCMMDEVEREQSRYEPLVPDGCLIITRPEWRYMRTAIEALQERALQARVEGWDAGYEAREDEGFEVQREIEARALERVTKYLDAPNARIVQDEADIRRAEASRDQPPQ